MSGHSKWSTIKHQKGAADAKRGAVFTKLANAITIAVKNNLNYSTLLEKARQANMPKDRIQRAINRATSKSEGELHEAVFEGFGPENVAIIIETITDNTTRTSQEIKNIFNKNNYSLGTCGYLFTRCGEIEVEGENIFEKALESGAEDVEDNFIYTNSNDLHKVKGSLKDLKIASVQLIYRPINFVEIIDETQKQEVVDFIDLLESLDDVQRVYTNLK